MKMPTAMQQSRALLKIIFIFNCISLCVKHVRSDVNCTAGIFVAGSAGFVQCDFGKDVRKDHHDFNVVWYAFNHTNYDDRKNLLACSWYNDQMTCPLKAPGYEFDNRVDSTLTLVIPVVDKSMAGLYRCQLVPKPSNTDMNFCTMNVIEMTRAVDTTDNTLVAGSNPNPGSENYYGQAFVAVSICLVIFFLLFVTATGMLLYVRKSFHFSRNHDYCKWLPSFWRLKEVQHGEEIALREEKMANPLPTADVLQNQQPAAGIFSGSQPAASSATEPLIAEGTSPPTHAAQTNVEDDENIENLKPYIQDDAPSGRGSATSPFTFWKNLLPE